MIGLYVTQQRAPFFITAALSLYILFKVLGKNKGVLTPIIRMAFIVGVVFGVSYFLAYTSSSEMRYAQGMQDRTRRTILRGAWEYLLSHPLFGGRFQSQSLGLRPPHNLFFNAWLYGGVFGLLVVLGITIKQVFLIAKQTIGQSFSTNYSKTIFGLAFFAYTANSMVHNQSIVTGDAVIWVLWGAFISLVTFNNQEIETEGLESASQIIAPENLVMTDTNELK